MLRTDHSTHRKLAAWIMGFVILAVLLFSAFYIAVETGHDCIGDHCPVCVCIKQCENTLHQIGNGAVILFAAYLPFLKVVLLVLLPVLVFSQKTPVSFKVRLNN